jgi:hypothetical protein
MLVEQNKCFIELKHRSFVNVFHPLGAAVVVVVVVVAFDVMG